MIVAYKRLIVLRSIIFGLSRTTFGLKITQGGTALNFGNPLGGTVILMNYPLSITEFNKNEFTLYPNPTKDRIFMEGDAKFINPTVKIYSCEGKLLRHQDITFEGRASFDVSRLSNGIYFMQITSERKQVTYKFIKE